MGPKGQLNTGWDGSSMEPAAMLALTQKVLKENPGLVSALRQAGPSVESVAVVKEAVTKALAEVRQSIAIPLEKVDTGNLGAGQYWVALEYRVDQDEERHAFEVHLDIRKKVYRVSSFQAQLTFKTLKGLLGGLREALPLLRKGMRGLDEAERAWLQGKLTSAAVVRSLLGVKVNYGRIDEWYDTNVTVELALRSKKPVPPKLVLRWVGDHWSEIAQKARRFGPPKSGYLDVARLSFADAEKSVSQEGSVAVVDLIFSRR